MVYPVFSVWKLRVKLVLPSSLQIALAATKGCAGIICNSDEIWGMDFDVRRACVRPVLKRMSAVQSAKGIMLIQEQFESLVM